MKLMYIDPGAGSMVLQVALGFAAAVLVGLKLFWARIIAFFKRLFGSRKDEFSQ